MSRKPQSPRVVCALLAALVAGGCLQASGQETDSASERRVSDRFDVRVKPDDGYRPVGSSNQVRQDGIDLKAVISAAYDDNIMLSSSAPQKDFIVRVAPSVAYTHGDPEGKDGYYLRLAYRPVGVIYSDHSQDNRIDQDAAWESGWRGEKLAFASGGRVQQLGDATPDTGRQSDRVVLDQVARLAWTPGEKLTYELAAGRSSTDYRDKSLVDSQNTYGEAAIRYNYSPKTRIGLVYRAGTFQVDGAGDQTVQRGTVQMQWKPREKIAFDLEAGAEHRKFDNGSSTNPVVEAKATWTPRPGTEIFVGGYRRTEASASLVGQNYDVTGASAGISQKFGQKWTGKLETGIENATYTRVSGAGIANRRDKILFVRPSVGYQLNENLLLEGFYRFERNDSNQTGLGYEDNTVGLRLGYQF